MKTRTTDKEMRSRAYAIVKVGYCQLQELLELFEADHYTCGSCGWKADFYYIGAGVWISTGYQPIGKSILTYEECKEIEKKVSKLKSNYKLSYIQKRAYARRYFDRIIKKVREV